jgi:hypothetical protein
MLSAGPRIFDRAMSPGDKFWHQSQEAFFQGNNNFCIGQACWAITKFRAERHVGRDQISNWLAGRMAIC